ncbi:uncharacterized protein DS421_2g57350 [Arachis hypogaea]|nr:uncharacterized protein DS421_2g57350 [Arachis hypogaea]
MEAKASYQKEKEARGSYCSYVEEDAEVRVDGAVIIKNSSRARNPSWSASQDGRPELMKIGDKERHRAERKKEEEKKKGKKKGGGDLGRGPEGEEKDERREESEREEGSVRGGEARRRQPRRRLSLPLPVAPSRGEGVTPSAASPIAVSRAVNVVAGFHHASSPPPRRALCRRRPYSITREGRAMEETEPRGSSATERGDTRRICCRQSAHRQTTSPSVKLSPSPLSEVTIRAAAPLLSFFFLLLLLSH